MKHLEQISDQKVKYDHRAFQQQDSGIEASDMQSPNNKHPESGIKALKVRRNKTSESDSQFLFYSTLLCLTDKIRISYYRKTEAIRASKEPPSAEI